MSGKDPDPTPPPTAPCLSSRQAPLNSPKPDVVGRLVINDRLAVHLDKSLGRAILEVRDAQNSVAGSLTFLGHLALIDCIERGYNYKATVVSISGGSVQLRIDPA